MQGRGWRPQTQLVAVLLVVLARHADGACNRIPQLPGDFAAATGVVDRPFSVPQERTAIWLRTCDPTSFGSTAADHVVTVAFPGVGGKRNLKVVTTGACPPKDVCKASGAGDIECDQVSVGPTGLELEPPSGTSKGRLRFPFPRIVRTLGPSGAARGLTGPAAIAVTTAPVVACGLAHGDCAAQPGVIACVDRLYAYESETSCATTPDPLFRQFTALPAVNSFAAACWTDPSVCPSNPLADELDLAVDADGNLLVPFGWTGVTPADPNMKRMVRGFFRHWTERVKIPTGTFVSSWSPEGRELFPILDVSPSGPPIAIDGSVDSPTYTVLRVARSVGRCKGGSNDGVLSPGFCGSGTWQKTCPNGNACGPNGHCPAGKCGELFDLAPRVEGGIGPLVVRRPSDLLLCRRGHGECRSSKPCASLDGPCEGYSLEADAGTVPLAPVVQTEQLAAFVAMEAADGIDRNGDGDTKDEVVVLEDRVAARAISLGPPNGCSLAARATDRGIVAGGELGAPTVAADGNVVAFLESEAAQGGCDEDGDGAATAAILRVYEVETGRAIEQTAGQTIAVDPTPVVGGRSLAVSKRRVFYRTPAGELRVFDGSQKRIATILGPASAVAVAGGNATFIGDDGRIRLWTGDGRAERVVAVAADRAALSERWIAAVLHDGDRAEIAVHRVDGGEWRRLGAAAADVAISGSLVAFVTPRHELEVYDADAGGPVVDVGHRASDFVVGDNGLVAFRTVDAGLLEVYDVGARALVPTGEAAVPCEPPVCERRSPYRFAGTQLRFLAAEDHARVIMVFDVPTRRATRIAVVSLEALGPFADPLVDVSGSLLFPSAVGGEALTLAVSMEDADGDGVPDGADPRPLVRDAAVTARTQEKPCVLSRWLRPWCRR